MPTVTLPSLRHGNDEAPFHGGRAGGPGATEVGLKGSDSIHVSFPTGS